MSEIITICSVLQSPIPCAPLFLAVNASSGVSAFAITYYSIVQPNQKREFLLATQKSSY